MSTRENAYMHLVGVEGDCPGIRVIPGDRDASVLWQKINPSPPCGSRMPFGGMLEPAEIETIGSWIAAGALDD